MMDVDGDIRMDAVDEPRKEGPRARAAAERLTRAFQSWPARKLKEEAIFYDLSRSGSKAQLAARLTPYHPDYLKAVEEDAGEAETDAGEWDGVSDSDATEPDTEGGGATTDEEEAPEPVGAEPVALAPAAPMEALECPEAYRGSREEAAALFESEWLSAGRTRGSARLAERIARAPALRDGAVLAMKRRIFAPGTWRTHRSRVRTATRVLKQLGAQQVRPHVGAGRGGDEHRADEDQDS